jgi:signal transduction histidine kinase
MIVFFVAMCFSLFLRTYMKNNDSITLTGEKIFFAIIFFALLILVLFACVADFILVRRIKRLTAASKSIASGDFDVRVKDWSDDELGELTESFNIMVKALRANEFLSREFVRNVSHEFKTPITSLKGYAKLLQNEELSQAERAEYAQIILQESERLHKLSADLLQLSALDSSEIVKQTKAFRLDEQIKRIILLMQRDWERKNIEMIVDVDETDYAGKEELIYLVWLNLISNAIKYTEPGGKIEIRLINGKNIVFKIKDSGIGIKDEIKDKIFDEFFIGDKSRNQGSSGLGLSITKKIIEKFGGNLSFTSREGEGTEFTVLLSHL